MSQQAPSLTNARHYALKLLWWSVSRSCVAGVFPSPEATALAAAHANMDQWHLRPRTYLGKSSRRCVSHPTIFRRPQLPRPPTWLDCEGRPAPDTAIFFRLAAHSATPSWLAARCSSSWSAICVQRTHQNGVHCQLGTTAEELHPLTNMLVRTRPPASRQILAATLSSASPRRPNIPARAQAAR